MNHERDVSDARVWAPDNVLLGFEATTIPLGRADDGDAVATLVRGMCDAPSRRAVLYVHGFVDYFFQSHVADAFNEHGWDFYALELRRYGRSLRGGQRPNYCTSLDEYDAEIEAALDIVRREEGHDTLVVLGHSTGGLIAAMYAHRGARRSRIDGIILNSPFLEFAVPFPRSLLLPVASLVGAVAPWIADPSGLSARYGESLLQEHRGEWTYDLAWKPLRGYPVYYGWIRAVRAAQAEARRGLRIDCPVLLLHSSASLPSGAVWKDEYMTHDIVLDVAHMKRIGPALGRDVTLREVQDGVHDLYLSREPVRADAIAATLAWLDARFPSGTPQDVTP